MNIAKLIDHTLLKPEATDADIKRICAEAREYDFMSVCVNPFYVPLAKKELEGTTVKVCTVIGFPLGANESEIKAAEAALAVKHGATEVDMVINVGKAKEHNYEFIEKEVALLKESVGKDIVLKVILETCLLTDEEIAECSKACKRANADFVKTSTGFSKGGATTHAVAIMREAVGPEMGVKASGGVHNKAELLAMVEAGATRIGASAGVAIVKE